MATSEICVRAAGEMPEVSVARRSNHHYDKDYVLVEHFEGSSPLDAHRGSNGLCYLEAFNELAHLEAIEELKYSPYGLRVKAFAARKHEFLSVTGLNIGVSRKGKELAFHLYGGMHDSRAVIGLLHDFVRVGHGIKGDEPPDEGVDKLKAGYCFKRLFKQDFHKELDALGPVTNGASLRRFANDHKNSYSSEGVSLCLANFKGEVIFHVTKGEFPAADVLTLIHGNARVGAGEAVDMTTVASAPGRHKALDTGTAGSTTTMIVPVGFILSNSDGHCSFSPRSHAVMLQLFAFFESVKLVSAEFTLTVTGGENAAAFAVVNTSGPPTNVFDWMAAPVAVHAIGSLDGASVTYVRLEEGHSFGQEVKGVSVGNKDPTFHFKYESQQPGHCVGRGHVHFEVSGTGNPTAINVGPPSGYRVQSLTAAAASS